MNFKFLRRPKVTSAIPTGWRIYAIGDVHGRLDLLERLFALIDADRRGNSEIRSMIVMLGDYIDRGPNSMGVIDFLVERGKYDDIVCMKGNHEAWLMHFLEDPDVLETWSKGGGLSTLASYGLKPSLAPRTEERSKLCWGLRRAMPQRHLMFLDELRPSFVFGDFCFVHAGVRPGVELGNQSESDMYWIRDEFLNHRAQFSKIIVHGHTPVPEPDVRTNRINIDTGAYATGKLTCLVLEADNRRFLTVSGFAEVSRRQLLENFNNSEELNAEKVGLRRSSVG